MPTVLIVCRVRKSCQLISLGLKALRELAMITILSRILKALFLP